MPTPVNNNNQTNTMASNNGIGGGGNASMESASDEESSNLLSQSPNVNLTSSAAAQRSASKAVNICRKSYAATLSRPSLKSTACEWNSARKRRVDHTENFASSPAAARGGGAGGAARLKEAEDDILDYDDDDDEEEKDEFPTPPNRRESANKKKKTGRGGMFRSYTKSYAHSSSSKAARSALSRQQSKDILVTNHDQTKRKKKRVPRPLAKKLQRAEARREKQRSPPLPMFEKSPMTTKTAPTPPPPKGGSGKSSNSPQDSNGNASDDSSDDSSKTTPLPDAAFPTKSCKQSKPKPDVLKADTTADPNELDAPTKFRTSYESKNQHSTKNLENIRQIAQMQEEALLVSSFIAVEEGGGAREEFSPLTCPNGFSQMGSQFGREEEDDDEDEEGSERGEDETSENGENKDGKEGEEGVEEEKDEEEVINNGLENEPVKDDADSENDEERDEDNVDNVEEDDDWGGGDNEMEDEPIFEAANDMDESDEDDASEHEDDIEASDDEDKQPRRDTGLKERYQRTLKPLTAMKPAAPPVKAAAKKRVRKGRKGAAALALAAEYNEPQKEQVVALKQPAATNAATAKRIKKKGRGAATALALAAEYNQELQTEPLASKTNEEQQHAENGDDKKRGKKRKQGPTALALAEYDETGEIDSYFDNSKAAEERKGRLRALAACKEDDGFDENDYVEDDGGASHHCDDEDDEENLPGTEKQSEPLLGTEKPSSENVNGSEKQSSEPAKEPEKQSEPLNGSEKQSEPLLSSSAPEPSRKAAAAAAPLASTSADAALTAADPPAKKSTMTKNEMICAIRAEYDEIGKALMCPICRSTLKKSIILPCVHAFCHGCLHDYYNPPRQPTRSGRRNKKQKASPPRKPKNECPVCKTATSGKRAGEEAPHLDELARAYKQMGKAFTFAPVVYGKNIVMTQMEPDENECMESSEEEDEDRKMPAVEETDEAKKKKKKKKRESTAHAYGEHLQVAKAVHSAFLERSATQLQHQPLGLRERIEHENVARRYQQMAKEQEDVVRVDQKAYNREIRRVGGTKQMVAAVTAKFAAEAVSGRRKEDVVARKDGAALASARGASNSSAQQMKPMNDQPTSGGVTLAMREAAGANYDKEPDELEAEKNSKVSANAKRDSTRRDNKEGVTLGGEEVNTPEVERAQGKDEEAKDKSILEGEEEEFFSAPDESQYSTAREESQGTASLLNVTRATISSPMVIHDGNTVKKAARPRRSLQPKSSLSSLRGSNVFDLERSPESLKRAARESTATGARRSVATAATSNSPIVLHDGNTVKKAARPQGSLERDEEKTETRGPLLLDLHNDPTPRRSGTVSPLAEAAAVQVNRAKEKTDKQYADLDTDDLAVQPRVMPNAAAALDATPENLEKEQQEKQIVKGSIVSVQARTWPGINKPGGVARVTKVHLSSENGGNGNSTKYDVAYVLGGKEKLVDESFVTLHEENESPTIEEEECTVNTNRTPRVTMSPVKKPSPRARRRRKAAMKPDPKPPAAAAAASAPVYSDEELKHIPADVLKWAGIMPKKKGRKKSPPGSPSKPRGKKRVLKESNAKPKAKPKPAKKQKTTPEPAKKQEELTSSHDVGKSEAMEDLREKLGSLSNEETVRLADSRYSSLLSLDKNQSDTASTFYAVTSSLSDKDSDALDSLIKVLKRKSVTLKITKDFNPNKTQLCITAATQMASSTEQLSEPVNVVSKSRTLKVMRSALAGIPLLTPQWIEACLREGHLVAPSGTMCIRSLPRKQQGVGNRDNTSTEHFGVAKYAVAYQQSWISSSNNLLSGFSIMICGSSAGSGMVKDLKVLLQSAGASIVGSASVASRHLADMSKKEAGDEFEGPLVLLCDDSTTDKTCGVSDALSKQVKKFVLDSGKSADEEAVLCVHFSWLFDSISCAAPMKAAGYEPLAPRTKALWNLTAAEGQTVNRGNREESQIY